MLTFVLLLVSMQCFIIVQRLHGLGRMGSLLIGLGVTGLCLSFAWSVYVHGIERGTAAWLISLMGAGLVAPFLAVQIERMQTACRPIWKRHFIPLGKRLQVLPK